MYLANLPDESITHMVSIAKPGVYYGYARVYPANDQPSELPPKDLVVFPMVMSLGWNPFYKNERMTAVCIPRFSNSPPLKHFDTGNPCHARVQVRLLRMQAKGAGAGIHSSRI